MPKAFFRLVASAFATFVATFLLATLLPTPTILHAQSPRAERISVFDVGIYCAETIARYPEPTAPGGYINTVTEPWLLKRTTDIPTRLGTRFGMRYIIAGTSEATVPVRLVTKLPSQGAQDPESGKTIFGGSYTFSVRVGATDFRGYQLEFDWERVPGVWTFEFWVNERKLAEQNFTLIDPLTTKKNLTGTSCSPLLSGINVPPTSASN